MTNNIFKNIEKEKILQLSDELNVHSGQIVSKTLVQNNSVNVTLFAFDKNEEISTHASGGDAFVTVLDGTGMFTVDGTQFILGKDQSLIMPAGKPHSVFAKEAFKMILTVVF